MVFGISGIWFPEAPSLDRPDSDPNLGWKTFVGSWEPGSRWIMDSRRMKMAVKNHWTNWQPEEQVDDFHGLTSCDIQSEAFCRVSSWSRAEVRWCRGDSKLFRWSWLATRRRNRCSILAGSGSGSVRSVGKKQDPFEASRKEDLLIFQVINLLKEKMIIQ